MSRLLRDAVIAFAALALGAGAFWTYLSTTTVTARNSTDQQLSDLKVGLTGKVFWRGDLGAGDSKWTFGMPRQDGSVEISYTIGGVTHQIQCGYVSPGPGGKAFVVEIRPGGQSHCEENA